MRKTIAQVQAAAAAQTAHTKRVDALKAKLMSLHAIHRHMTTGPDHGPIEWYEVNGQLVLVHLFANQRGFEVYAPVDGAGLTVQGTLDALDRIADSNPKPLSVDRQLTGAVGDLVRMAAMGNTDADDLQRLACVLLGQTKPNPRGAARGIAEEMLQPQPAAGDQGVYCYTLYDDTDNSNHGSFETLHEARGAASFDNLDAWTIYRKDEIVASYAPDAQAKPQPSLVMSGTMADEVRATR